MDLRIFYVLFYIIVAAIADMCSVEKETPCSYVLTCTDNVDIDVSWDRFRYFGQQSQYDEECNNYYSYNGYNLLPVKLVLRQTNNRIIEQVPYSSNWNVQQILNIVYNLDISENNFRYTPIIQSMTKLASLNMSRNELPTAVLSNNVVLERLTEIDLSHNMINDIKVNIDEHPYNKLVVIDLSHNYIVNIPDAVLDLFDDLKTLDLSYNYIDILSQFTFEGIKKLINLNLSHNRLIDINSSLFRFSELQILNLSANKIEEININDFKQLVKLKKLDLSSNSIKTIDFNVFSAMNLLNTLDLNHNLLEIVNKNTFSYLHSLHTIDLANNKIRTLPVGLFKNMTIITFSISANRLEGSLVKGMFEGVDVSQLDLSNQFLTEIKDYTFHNLLRLDTLILKSNGIQTLSNKCFQSLVNLQTLDLSNNQISNINFDKGDLGNLLSFILKNNRLTQIKHEELQNLDNLEFLDISENEITHLESSSFRSLKSLINLEINNNPLVGALETDTFKGLVLLPSLDISNNMLTTIQNASFNDMTALKDLDISHCQISELQYNVFVNTGYIEILNLSYNKIQDFLVNTTELVGLSTLFLHNNLIKAISPTSLLGLSRLNNITLSHNVIASIDNESLNSLSDLRYLDVSYNEKCNINMLILDKVKDLNSLILSGIKTIINFDHLEQDTQITYLVISNASIKNISDLYLHKIPQVDTLDLSYNNVSELRIGDFAGLNVLRHLDLSFNKITRIQPGTFKNNTAISSLNISHNGLQSVSYGIFRGLYYLNVLDLSHNNIKDLRGERFYELRFLSHLIVDYNKIDSLNVNEFLGTSLRKLSIGDNPIPCDILVKLSKSPMTFEITAIRKDEHMNENINGVVCNKLHKSENPGISEKNKSDNELLNKLQNMLLNISHDNVERENKDTPYLEKISNLLEKSNSIYEEKFTNLINLTSNVRVINNKTYLMFNQIIQLLNKTRSEAFTTTTVPPKEAVTIMFTPNTGIDSSINKSDVISYVNKIKGELEDAIAREKQNIIKEFKSKFDSNNYKTNSLPNTQIEHQKLVSNSNEVTKSLFTETCVALILVILVGFVLYKFYKSRMFIRNRFSISTRELPGAMENSNL